MGRGPELPEVQHGGGDSLTAGGYTGEMNEQEALTVIAEIVLDIAPSVEGGYDGDRVYADPVASAMDELRDALVQYRDAVLAAQPCYPAFEHAIATYGRDDLTRPEFDLLGFCPEDCDCVCPPCQARERMKAELTTV